MSILSSVRTASRWRSLAAAVAIIGGQSRAALTVTPSSLSNSFNGTIDLAITGLNSAGQTVIIEKYFDSDASSTITGNDQLVQYLRVTDGQVSSIGGRQNLNVPGDEDGSANLAILTRLRSTTQFTPDRLAGRFIFRISPAGAGFAAFTNSLIVTQADYGGSGVSGRVMGSGSPQARAMVLFTSGSTNDFDVRGVAMTDASGNYSLKLPAGTYRPVSAKSGFVCDLALQPAVTVSSGAFAASADAVLTVSGRNISGLVRDAAAPNAPLPGVLVFGQSQSGMFALTFSTNTGNYTLPATPGEWFLGLLEWPVTQLGMLQGEEYGENSLVSVTGFHLEVPRATALIYGTVRTPANVPVPYISVNAENDGGSPEWQGSGVTDVNGNYTLGTLAGNWRVDGEAPGYLIPQAIVAVPAPGATVQANITANPITAYLRGQVRDNLNNPVPNIEVLAYDSLNTNSWGFTDAGGNFVLGVYGGPGNTARTWSLQLNQGGDGETMFIGPNVEFQVTGLADITNIVYNVLRVTAHLRGTLLLDGTPTSGYQLYANAQNFSGNSGSDAGSGGAFDIPVLAGTWQVGLSGQPAGIIWQDNLTLTVLNNQDQNGLTFHLRTANRTIEGRVLDSLGNIPNDIGVTGTITVSGVSYSTSTRTTPGGFYNLPAFPGTWSVSLNSSDLFNQGYQPAASQNANTTAGNAININFTATTGGGGSAYSNWLASFFTPAELADSNISGANADPDRDGIVNLLEYAFNFRPKVSESGSQPTIGYQPPAGPAAAFLTLTFNRLTGNPGVAYNAQEAPDTAGPWTPVAASYEVVSSHGTWEVVKAKTPIGPGKKFLRLQVVLTSP